MISAACSGLLEASSRLHPLYGDGLSNHLPMTLIALDALGASSAQLQRFAAHYSPRLTVRAVTQPPLEPDAVLGQRESFEGVRSCYRHIATRKVAAQSPRTDG
jgi:cytochrome P450